MTTPVTRTTTPTTTTSNDDDDNTTISTKITWQHKTHMNNTIQHNAIQYISEIVVLHTYLYNITADMYNTDTYVIWCKRLNFHMHF